MTLYPILATACLACLSVMFISCGGSTATVFSDSWKDPSAGRLAFKKVLVLAMHPEEIIRRSTENRMAENITRTEAIPAHTFLTQEDVRNVEAAKAKVRERGFDGAVIIRLLEVSEQERYAGGRYASDPVYRSSAGPMYSFWGYYGAYYPVIYESGYTVSREYLIIETRIYSVADEKLLWSGLSKTPRPDSMRELMDDLARAAAEQLKAEGLLE
jgi:hypothetical protein